MARKITPQEVCPFCDAQPCVCQTVSRKKKHRDAPAPQPDEGEPDEAR